MIFRRTTLVLFLLAGGVAQGAPKEPPPPPPPPMAQPLNVSIFRGRSVEIPLRAIGRAPSQLKFLIRAKPAHGRLGAIRFTGPKSAVVTYTHAENTGAGTDTFTYAVQAADTAVSAPAPVRITISEEPPALSVVHSLDFGRLLLGETREEEITIRNTGGGVLTGTIKVPEPWKVLDSADYRLGRKQERKIRILFSPESEGDYSDKIAFTHDSRSAVNLTGSATPPLRFEPERQIELTRPESGSRASARLLIRNETPDSREVEITVPPEIVAPAEISVPGQGEVEVTLETQTDFLGALEGRVSLESGGFRQEIPLRVFALQPVLLVEPRDGLNFGDLPPRRRFTKMLSIENNGGVAARLKVTAPPEVLLLPDPNTAVLAPGEKRVFEVAFEPGTAGEYEANIAISSDGSAAVNLPITARINDPKPPTTGKIPTAILAPIVPPEPGEAGPSAAASFSTIPPITGVMINRINKRDLELSWKKPAPTATGYIIEQRKLETIKDAPPKIIWEERRQIKISADNDRVVARFENLAPGQTWFLRISSLNETGRRSAPSQTIRITSPPDQRIGWFWVVAFLVIAGAATFAVKHLRQRRELDAASEAERIARLGKG